MTLELRNEEIRKYFGCINSLSQALQQISLTNSLTNNKNTIDRRDDTNLNGSFVTGMTFSDDNIIIEDFLTDFMDEVLLVENAGPTAESDEKGKYYSFKNIKGKTN